MGGAVMGGAVVIPLPDGYDLAPAWAYHSRDARRAPDAPAERLGEGGALTRALLIDGEPVALTLTPDPDGRHLSVSVVEGTMAPAALAALARRLLGLTAPMDAAVAGLAARAEGDALTACLIGPRRAFRPPLAASVFEALVWAVIGQQITVSFAADLRRQLILVAGRPLACGMVAHPDAAAVAALGPSALTSRRFSRAKAAYLIGAARAVVDGLDLEGLADPVTDRGADRGEEEAMRILLALRGIGPWTANYVLLRGCGLVDRVPVGDAGLATALRNFYALDHKPGPAEQADLMAPFAPWRGLATAHLWAGHL